MVGSAPLPPRSLGNRECPLLGEHLEEHWLPAIEHTVRRSTFVSYRSHVLRHIVPLLGSVSLAELDARDLNNFYAMLLATGRRRGSGGLSPTTVRRIHATLHRALRDAVRWGLLGENPTHRSDPPRQAAGHEITTWTAAQLRAFLTGVRTDTWYPIWHLLAMTGMRRGEVLGLRWEDVDLPNHRLAVRQTLIAVGYDVRLSTPKTRRSRRVVALDDRTANVLEQHRKADGQYALVFARADGSGLHPCRVTRRFAGLVQGSGLPRLRLHDLRHTHATLALRAGVHPKIVSERLGHATVTITLDLYSHASESMQTEAAGVVSDIVFGGIGRRS
jgi:integrase